MRKDNLYPLRKLHGVIHDAIVSIKYHLGFVFPFGKKIYIIGSPVHSNLGDSAILIAQKNFLVNCGINKNLIKEVTYDEYKYNKKVFLRVIRRSDLICGLGGGNMGNQWPLEDEMRFNIINSFPKNNIIIFPQTIYFSNDESGQNAIIESKKYYKNNKKLTIFARDKKSYSIMKDLYSDTRIKYAPDIVLSGSYSDFCDSEYEKKDILLCFRNDSEKSINNDDYNKLIEFLTEKQYNFTITDMHTDNYRDVLKNKRLSDVQLKFKEFATAKLVITDRLHGMILSAIAGTPCIALNNYNHKVKGTFDNIRYLRYIKFAEKIDDGIKLIPEMISADKCEFDNAPLQKYYNELAEVVKNFVN